MYQLKRTTKTPSSPMRVLVADGDGVDAGLAAGGTFYFQPAGEDGSEYTVNEHVARTVMEDHGLAKHFSCTPGVPVAKPKADTKPTDDSKDDRNRIKLHDKPGPNEQG